MQKTRACVIAGWDDVPHLSKEEKEKLEEDIPPFQRDARIRGIPQLNEGLVFPVAESDFIVDDFDIPSHWPRAYGMDVGWRRTAAVWGAHNIATNIRYLYAEYYRGQMEPVVHAAAIRGRGLWIPGAIDPAARGRGQDDGKKLLTIYRDLGLTLTPADNAVESGIYDTWTLLSTGGMKVFRSLFNWLKEYRNYRRDDNGSILGEDHLMDSTRYLVRTGFKLGIVQPKGDQDDFDRSLSIGRSKIGGY